MRTRTEVLATGVTLLGVADAFGSPGRDAMDATAALTAVRDYLRRRQRLGMIAGKVQSAGALRTFLLHAFEHANERLYHGQRKHRRLRRQRRSRSRRRWWSGITRSSVAVGDGRGLRAPARTSGADDGRTTMIFAGVPT